MFRPNVQNVLRWLQRRLSVAPFADRVVNHFLIQSIPFLLDRLTPAQPFHVHDPVVLVGSPTPRSQRRSDPDCSVATEGGISTASLAWSTATRPTLDAAGSVSLT